MMIIIVNSVPCVFVPESRRPFSLAERMLCRIKYAQSALPKTMVPACDPTAGYTRPAARVSPGGA